MSLRGVLHLFSETGTEGGHWAFQDEAHITREAPEWGVFEGQAVFDHDGRSGKTIGAWHQDGRTVADPMHSDPDYPLSSLFRGQDRGDRDADRRLMERWGFEIHYLEKRPGDVPGGTPGTSRRSGLSKGDMVVAHVQWEDGSREMRRSDTLLQECWSYEGLHVLEDGDHLTIFEGDGNTIAWEGEIKLIRHPLFTEVASGMWIHADQEGIDRDVWATYFFEGRPARLMRKSS